MEYLAKLPYDWKTMVSTMAFIAALLCAWLKLKLRPAPLSAQKYNSSPVYLSSMQPTTLWRMLFSIMHTTCLICRAFQWMIIHPAWLLLSLYLFHSLLSPNSFATSTYLSLRCSMTFFDTTSNIIPDTYFIALNAFGWIYNRTQSHTIHNFSSAMDIVVFK